MPIALCKAVPLETEELEVPGAVEARAGWEDSYSQAPVDSVEDLEVVAEMEEPVVLAEVVLADFHVGSTKPTPR